MSLPNRGTGRFIFLNKGNIFTISEPMGLVWALRKATIVILVMLLVGFIVTGTHIKKTATKIQTKAYSSKGELKQIIATDQQWALKTMAGEYVSIANLTSGGKAFKEAILKNVSEENLTNSEIFAIAKHKSLDLYAIADYNSSDTTVGSIGLYILNMSTMKSYWKNKNVIFKL